MRKWIVATGLVLVALVACFVRSAPRNEKNLSPTGYPTGELQRSYLFYEGKLYIYSDQTTRNGLPESYKKVGAVESVDNKSYPHKDFVASRLPLGLEIYAQSKGAITDLYVSTNKPGIFMIFEPVQ